MAVKAPSCAATLHSTSSASGKEDQNCSGTKRPQKPLGGCSAAARHEEAGCAWVADVAHPRQRAGHLRAAAGSQQGPVTTSEDFFSGQYLLLPRGSATLVDFDFPN